MGELLMNRAWFKSVASAVVALGMIAANSLAAEVPTDYQPKYDEGYGLGYPIGYKSGLNTGKDRGRTEGWSTGKSEGFTSGSSAAYSPAFDLAYDARFPVGHRAGWETGLVEGFEEGFDYAPTYVAILNDWYNSSSLSAGNLTITSNFNSRHFDYSNGTNLIDSLAGTLSVWLIGSYDWNRHYFDQGFDEGKTAGFSVGSEDGYNLTYPIAYAGGYKIGFRDGVGVGTRNGTRDGREQGYDDGWDEGYGGGFDEGFYAGLDYHLFGEFVEPTYALQYTRRSNAFTVRSLKALQAPEPASLLLVGLAVGAGMLVRPGCGRRG